MNFENTDTYGNFGYEAEQYEDSTRVFRKAEIIMKLNQSILLSMWCYSK